MNEQKIKSLKELEKPEPVEILNTDFAPKIRHSGSDEELTMLGLYSPDNEDFDN